MNLSGEDTGLRCDTPFSDVPLGHLFYPAPFGTHGWYKDSATTGNWCGVPIRISPGSGVAVAKYARVQADAEADDPVDYPRVIIQQDCPDAATLGGWLEPVRLQPMEVTFPITAGTVIRCFDLHPRSDNMAE